MTLHDTEELDDDLRRRADEDLALATALSVDDVVLDAISAPPRRSGTCVLTRQSLRTDTRTMVGKERRPRGGLKIQGPE